MDKKRVGIITLPGNFNYGNRLQCYAMARAVERAGCKADVLEREHFYRWPLRVCRAMKRFACTVLGKGDFPEKMRTPARAAAFDRFGRNIPTVVLPGMGHSAMDVYGTFVVGSDQVWNPYSVRRQRDWYFAKFARPEQRVAVAASLGVDAFADADQAKLMAEGVKGFAHVAVRERRGAELIKECSGIDAEVICDPTLVLSAEDWRAVADGRLTPGGVMCSRTCWAA